MEKKYIYFFIFKSHFQHNLFKLETVKNRVFKIGILKNVIIIYYIIIYLHYIIQFLKIIPLYNIIFDLTVKHG